MDVDFNRAEINLAFSTALKLEKADFNMLIELNFSKSFHQNHERMIKKILPKRSQYLVKGRIANNQTLCI